MRKKNQHVFPFANGWAVKEVGKDWLTLISQTQKDAITVAREIAKKNRAQLVIHRRNGRIREKDSYRQNYTS